MFMMLRVPFSLGEVGYTAGSEVGCTCASSTCVPVTEHPVENFQSG